MSHRANIPSSAPRRKPCEVKRKRGTRAHKKAMRTKRALFPVCQRCSFYCATETHHIIPMAAGGSDQAFNLESLCNRCHEAQHNPPRIGSETEAPVPRGGADHFSKRKPFIRKPNPWQL